MALSHRRRLALPIRTPFSSLACSLPPPDLLPSPSQSLFWLLVIHPYHLSLSFSNLVLFFPYLIKTHHAHWSFPRNRGSLPEKEIWRTLWCQGPGALGATEIPSGEEQGSASDYQKIVYLRCFSIAYLHFQSPVHASFLTGIITAVQYRSLTGYG